MLEESQPVEPAQPASGPSYIPHAQEFVELHEQVQTSVTLLDSLESFLSTFQRDLSAVSGQISNLQDRSKDIDNRLKSRRKIEKPLSSLLEGLIIPPGLATLILDTNVGEPWIEAIAELEDRLDALKVRARVKAARDLSELAEGLRIVAATKLRGFFLTLLQPIRISMSTNMQVIQTSVFLKYRALFAFLQRYAAPVANEVQRAYVGAARTFYETGFRRYIRSLGWLKARIVEKPDSIVDSTSLPVSEGSTGAEVDVERLAHAHIDGPGVILAYMADDKAHKEPPEALLRSLLLVLMDNATAEYTFVTSFFGSDERPPLHHKDTSSSFRSPTSMLSPTRGEFDDIKSNSGGDLNAVTRPRVTSMTSVMSLPQVSSVKEEQAALHSVWKQILEPVLDYCQIFLRTLLDPAPPAIPLLTMIRLTEEVIAEVQRRDCAPLESFIFGIRLQMWPVFQKMMSEQVDALKKLAQAKATGYFSSKPVTTETGVLRTCQRYVILFTSFIALTEQAEETMIFSNLVRLRQELSKLIASHTDKISDDVQKATTQRRLYDALLQGLSRGPTSHPKAQSEMAYWREREEEARRRAASTHGRK